MWGAFFREVVIRISERWEGGCRTKVVTAGIPTHRRRPFLFNLKKLRWFLMVSSGGAKVSNGKWWSPIGSNGTWGL